MERLLEDVATHGWAKESREAFVRRYDREIGETILHLLAEYGLIGDRRALRSLKSYIESRLNDRRAESEHPLWEIVEEVYMNMYREIFEKKLVPNYVSGVQQGTVASDFMGYLRGAVRQRLLDVLGAGEKSEKELFDAIADSKKPDTIRKHISDAKGRYGEKARAYLLCEPTCQGTAGARLQAITDYFFEKFVAEKYVALRKNLKPGDSVLSKLLEAFVTERSTSSTWDDRITSYIGQIAASRPNSKRWTTLRQSETESDAENNEEEALERAGAHAKTKDWAQPERLLWWDRMLRCRRPTEAELAEFQRLLSALTETAQRDTKLCLACAQLKSESPAEQQDDLRMFLVYYLSNYGAASNSETHRESLTRETLCLESLRGRAISWEEIFKIFGRECNPTRIKNRVRQKYEALQGSPP